ncbi:hypothetical protein [Erythrobacter aureus]|uniref:hypothetical protein n=1 Tax=Erythrobacter aureus TaxID=2182384 RepID=UPI0013B42952|nr:hypothetical protein [Erythrobacter aureus]
MTTSYRRLVLKPFIVLLMLVAMVFVTAADAAACGAEVMPEASAVLIDGNGDTVASASIADEEPGGDSAPTEQHGVCNHGHCHHGASFAAPVQKTSVMHEPVLLVSAPPMVLVSSVSDRLRRPPRA